MAREPEFSCALRTPQPKQHGGAMQQVRLCCNMTLALQASSFLTGPSTERWSADSCLERTEWLSNGWELAFLLLTRLSSNNVCSLCAQPSARAFDLCRLRWHGARGAAITQPITCVPSRSHNDLHSLSMRCASADIVHRAHAIARARLQLELVWSLLVAFQRTGCDKGLGVRGDGAAGAVAGGSLWLMLT